MANPHQRHRVSANLRAFTPLEKQRSISTRRRRSSLTGFTLIELTVVTAIIVLITSVVLANNNRFGGIVLLQNLTYDVALSIRQAQIYGISVTRFAADPTFSAGYGVDFDLSSPSAYTLFADISGNGLYDCTDPGSIGCEIVGATSISSGYHIQSLCATPAQGIESCSGVLSLDVLFKRPEPDAWISANGNSCLLQSSNCEESARIILESPRGDTMSVVVEANGQISVRK